MKLSLKKKKRWKRWGVWVLTSYSPQICKIHHELLHEGREEDSCMLCNGDMFYRVILFLVVARLAAVFFSLAVTQLVMFNLFTAVWSAVSSNKKSHPKTIFWGDFLQFWRFSHHVLFNLFLYNSQIPKEKQQKWTSPICVQRQIVFVCIVYGEGCRSFCPTSNSPQCQMFQSEAPFF